MKIRRVMVHLHDKFEHKSATSYVLGEKAGEERIIDTDNVRTNRKTMSSRYICPRDLLPNIP